ncbi:hypothetical protein FVE85_0872 [Porphyridium purpureum]|uniref:Uncharacterized protein n=1 Tax=Porphyridium purpureum TaxID=35688 RepID=A0A5J4Z2K1_PORPP|nr:hypothetical protein FVE85_0872 [Porphyridium purpureum]|eukprot:POR2353..scf208_2
MASGGGLHAAWTRRVKRMRAALLDLCVAWRLLEPARAVWLLLPLVALALFFAGYELGWTRAAHTMARKSVLPRGQHEDTFRNQSSPNVANPYEFVFAAVGSCAEYDKTNFETTGYVFDLLTQDTGAPQGLDGILKIFERLLLPEDRELDAQTHPAPDPRMFALVVLETGPGCQRRSRDVDPLHRKTNQKNHTVSALADFQSKMFQMKLREYDEHILLDNATLVLRKYEMASSKSSSRRRSDTALRPVDLVVHDLDAWTRPFEESTLVFVSANVSGWEAVQWLEFLIRKEQIGSATLYLDLKVYDASDEPGQWQAARVLTQKFNNMMKMVRKRMNTDSKITEVALSRVGFGVEGVGGVSDDILFTVLAGNSTFGRRVFAQADTFMRLLPPDNVLITTNVEQSESVLERLESLAGPIRVDVVSPARPELEPRLHMMQSWSHLVRVRESWDLIMKDNPRIKWLALIDDDVFIFPSSFSELIRRRLTSEQPTWGGDLELIRIDNGDADGRYRLPLRKQYFEASGTWCHMQDEPGNMTRELHASLTEEYQKVHPYMPLPFTETEAIKSCNRTFCRTGCNNIIQGGTIVLNRALVEQLRPHIEACEAETTNLCPRCGSQRLYFCIKSRLDPFPTSVWLKEVRRFPWKKELIYEDNKKVVSYHGFEMENKYWCRNIHQEMRSLMELELMAEKKVTFGTGSGLVSQRKVGDKLACHDKGTLNEEALKERKIKCIPKFGGR